MMNSISSLLEFARSNPLSRRQGQDVGNDNPASASAAEPSFNDINTAVITKHRAPSPGPYDLPEESPGPYDLPEESVMVAAPIPSTFNNIRKAAASGPLKKRTAGAKHKAPTSKQEQQQRPKKPRRTIPENKQYIPENERPTDADVVGGRGGRSNHHAGNRPYWIKILGSRHYYRTCQSDAAKTMIAEGILNYVKKEKGGRFLNLDSKTNRWFVLPDVVVLDKIKQALRDKYVPFWAKNIDIPIVQPGSLSSTSNLLGGAIQSNSRTSRSPLSLSNKQSDDGGSNKLAFLLSAGRAAATAAIPTMDDALKCKIDSTFGQNMGQGSGTDSRMSFAFPASLSAGFPGGPSGNAPGASAFGMNMFHSVQNANLFASMASLGGGGFGANLAAATGGGVSHGFGIGGNSGAPSLGGGFPPGLLNSSGLQSSDLERYLESSKMSGSTKSVDLLQSLTGGGMASIGSLGGISFGFPDSLGPTVGATESGNGAKASSSSAAAAPGSSSNKKTDWNAMFQTALKKHEAV